MDNYENMVQKQLWLHKNWDMLQTAKTHNWLELPVWQLKFPKYCTSKIQYSSQLYVFNPELVLKDF